MVYFSSLSSTNFTWSILEYFAPDITDSSITASIDGSSFICGHFYFAL